MLKLDLAWEQPDEQGLVPEANTVYQNMDSVLALEYGHRQTETEDLMGKGYDQRQILSFYNTEQANNRDKPIDPTVYTLGAKMGDAASPNVYYKALLETTPGDKAMPKLKDIELMVENARRLHVAPSLLIFNPEIAAKADASLGARFSAFERLGAVAHNAVVEFKIGKERGEAMQQADLLIKEMGILGEYVDSARKTKDATIEESRKRAKLIAEKGDAINKRIADLEGEKITYRRPDSYIAGVIYDTLESSGFSAQSAAKAVTARGVQMATDRIKNPYAKIGAKGLIGAAGFWYAKSKGSTNWESTASGLLAIGSLSAWTSTSNAFEEAKQQGGEQLLSELSQGKTFEEAVASGYNKAVFVRNANRVMLTGGNYLMDSIVFDKFLTPAAGKAASSILLRATEGSAVKNAAKAIARTVIGKGAPLALGAVSEAVEEGSQYTIQKVVNGAPINIGELADASFHGAMGSLVYAGLGKSMMKTAQIAGSRRNFFRGIADTDTTVRPDEHIVRDNIVDATGAIHAGGTIDSSMPVGERIMNIIKESNPDLAEALEKKRSTIEPEAEVETTTLSREVKLIEDAEAFAKENNITISEALDLFLLDAEAPVTQPDATQDQQGGIQQSEEGSNTVEQEPYQETAIYAPATETEAVYTDEEFFGGLSEEEMFGEAVLDQTEQTTTEAQKEPMPETIQQRIKKQAKNMEVQFSSPMNQPLPDAEHARDQQMAMYTSLQESFGKTKDEAVVASSVYGNMLLSFSRNFGLDIKSLDSITLGRGQFDNAYASMEMYESGRNPMMYIADDADVSSISHELFHWGFNVIDISYRNELAKSPNEKSEAAQRIEPMLMDILEWAQYVSRGTLFDGKKTRQEFLDTYTKEVYTNSGGWNSPIHQYTHEVFSITATEYLKNNGKAVEVRGVKWTDSIRNLFEKIRIMVKDALFGSVADIDSYGFDAFGIESRKIIGTVPTSGMKTKQAKILAVYDQLLNAADPELATVADMDAVLEQQRIILNALKVSDNEISDEGLSKVKADALEREKERSAKKDAEIKALKEQMTEMGLSQKEQEQMMKEKIASLEADKKAMTKEAIDNVRKQKIEEKSKAYRDKVVAMVELRGKAIVVMNSIIKTQEWAKENHYDTYRRMADFMNQVKRDINQYNDEGRIDRDKDVVNRVMGSEAFIEKSKINLKQFTLQELNVMDAELTKIKQEGQVEYDLWKKQKNETQASVSVKMAEAILGTADGKGAMAGVEDTGKIYSKNPVFRALQLVADWNTNSLTSLEMWDMLDKGLSTYDGPFATMMYNITKNQLKIANDMAAARKLGLEEKMAELGMKGDYSEFSEVLKDQVEDIQAGRRGGQKWTRSDIIGMLMLARSPKGLSALMGGTLQTDNPQVLDRFLAQLNEQDIAIAEHLINDMELNFERINEGVRKATGSGMLKEDLYVTLFRVELEGKNNMAEISEKLGIAPPTNGTQTTNTGFTKEKLVIKDEHQTGVATDALSVWANHVHSTEYTAAMGAHLIDMVSVLNTKMSDIFRHLDDSGIKYDKSLMDRLKENKDQDRTINQMITRRFGKGVRHAVDSFIRRAAIDGMGYANSVLDTLLDKMTKNVQIQALAASTSFMITNPTSIALFAPRSGYIGATMKNLIINIGVGMANPNQLIKRVRELFPEMKQRQRNLEWGSLYKSYENNHSSYANRMRRLIDVCVSTQTWTEAVGFMAAYQSNLDEGLSNDDAIMYARKTVLVRQPAGSAVDMPVLYAESKLLRYMQMFTGDLNSKWRMLTYEVPNNFKRGNITAAGGQVLAVAASMLMYQLIRRGGPKDDETWAGWAAKAVALQTIELPPLAGKMILSAVDLWQGKFRDTDAMGAPVKKIVFGSLQVFSGIKESDTDQVIKGGVRAFEGATTFTPWGFPMRGASIMLKTGKALKEERYEDAWNEFWGRNMRTIGRESKYLKPQY